jgi:hypothetical protein
MGREVYVKTYQYFNFTLVKSYTSITYKIKNVSVVNALKLI